MSLRTHQLLVLTTLPAAVASCDFFWGERDYPCEVLLTCAIPPDAGGAAGAMNDGGGVAEAGGNALDSAVRDGGTAGADGSDSSGSDGNASGDVALHGDASEDGIAETGPICDGAKAPHEDPCAIDEHFGVFVAPSAIGATADGTRAHPYTSLADALQRAKTSHKHVFACDDGTGYSASLSVGPSADGVKVFGGFECAGWTYSTTRRAKLVSSTSPVLTITEQSAGVTLEDFEIVAKDAENPGQSSIGVVVNQSTGVVLRRVKITAGKGRDGAKGENGGGPSNTQAADGNPGKPGAKACWAKPNLGGTAVETECSGIPCGTSGSGGNGALNVTAGGENGGVSSSSGQGGVGEPLSGTWGCDIGQGHPGGNGLDGPPGASGTGLGSLTATGWKGNDGADGTAGQPGQGGGGGGGARAPNACTATDGGALSPTGASGGGGGSGGCGGSGGKGGTTGGSSIALVSLGSDVALELCELIASDAGKGGNGGRGQGGGIGGGGGSGGVGSGNPQSKAACAGGNGGQGGNGGAGGGGMGGHSIGVAYRGKVPAGLDPASVKVGTNGTGGQPGSGTGNADDGVAVISQSFDTADAGD